MELSRSSYYAWRRRPESKRTRANLELVEKITQIHEQSRGTYGAPRIAAQLHKQEGAAPGHNRVAGIMRKMGIFGCAVRKFRMGTTDSRHNLPIAPRLFKVEEPSTHPVAPNRVWAGDTTYIDTAEGWLYLTIQLDVFTRKVVGYSMADNLRAEATWEALRLAIQRQEGALSLNEPSLVTHSDRGVQYASDFYQEKLKKLGITASMSRSGNCYDNAFAETFFHTLKVELVHRTRYETRAEAEASISEYIDDWYNGKRLHSGLGYQTPMDYELKAA